MTETHVQTPFAKTTRRNFRRGIAIFVLTAFVILLIVALISIPGTPEQVSIISNTFVICFVLLPCLICLVPIYILILAAIYGVFVVHNGTGSILGRVQGLTQTASTFMLRWMERAGKLSIGINSRFAFLSGFFSVFDPKPDNSNGINRNNINDDDTTSGEKSS